MTGSPLDNNIYLMLGEMNGKLDGIQTSLSVMTSRADNHEKRLKDLEDWKIASESQLRGATKFASFIKGAIIIAMAALAYLGYRVTLQPDHVQQHVTTEKIISSD